ncbi:MAG TPA: gas vesicle protein K [Yinghuangia sp.]|uniref:gas vesicle protein K n=1 Tax=Yinghuangia sp. YIM S10712 TaxID=3436930 RepID=UPI002BD6BD49|nr:gas vesicle protein K [Yinghuangia sp.]
MTAGTPRGRPSGRPSDDPFDDWWPAPEAPDRGRARDKSGSRTRRSLDADPDSVERDLVRLVLTVVELLRQLMERQALRRVDAGDLTEDQEERIGLTLMLLEDRMETLRRRFDLTPADLNLDLGPLGPLLPRDYASNDDAPEGPTAQGRRDEARHPRG